MKQGNPFHLHGFLSTGGQPSQVSRSGVSELAGERKKTLGSCRCRVVQQQDSILALLVPKRNFSYIDMVILLVESRALCV